MKIIEVSHINFLVLSLVKESILEVGCGEGEYYSMLRREANKRGISLQYKGIDIDPTMILECKQRFPEAKELFSEGDATNLNFPDKSFNNVFMIEIIEHFKRMQAVSAALEEAKRVAKKRIIIETPDVTEKDTLQRYHLAPFAAIHISIPSARPEIRESPHRHGLLFSKNSLKELLSKHFTKFEVVQLEPIEVLKFPCYKKLAAEILL